MPLGPRAIAVQGEHAPWPSASGLAALVQLVEVVAGRDVLLIRAVVENGTAVVRTVDRLSPAQWQNLRTSDVRIGARTDLRRVKERHVADQLLPIAAIARPAIVAVAGITAGGEAVALSV